MGGARRTFSIDDYAYERGEELHRLGAQVDQLVFTDLGDEFTVAANLRFGSELQAGLRVFEVIEVRDGRPHRRKYTYQLTYRGEFIVRHDRDAVQHPRMPDHMHLGSSRRRVRGTRRTLHDAVDELYEVIRQREADEKLAGAS